MSEKKIIHLKEQFFSEEAAVLINNLNLNVKFGFYEHEKLKKQKLIFNIKLFIEPDKYSDKDLQEIVDYDKVIKIIKNILKDQINFLETLADRIIKKIFEDSRIYKIYIKIEKPDAIKECKSVGYTITKKRNS